MEITTLAQLLWTEECVCNIMCHTLAHQVKFAAGTPRRARRCMVAQLVEC